MLRVKAKSRKVTLLLPLFCARDAPHEAWLLQQHGELRDGYVHSLYVRDEPPLRARRLRDAGRHGGDVPPRSRDARLPCGGAQQLVSTWLPPRPGW